MVGKKTQEILTGPCSVLIDEKRVKTIDDKASIIK